MDPKPALVFAPEPRKVLEGMPAPEIDQELLDKGRETVRRIVQQLTPKQEQTLASKESPAQDSK